MSNTFPAAFCFENLALDATVTASASLPATPPSLLQDEQVGKRWCAETDTAYLTIALGGAEQFDFVGLYGLNLSTAATTRVRASVSDTSAVAGDVFDTGSVTGGVSAYYRALAVLRPALVTAAYLRIDLTEPGIDRILAGFLIIGQTHQVGINFSPGAADTPVDPSVVTVARMGAMHVDPRVKYRNWEFAFDWLSATERFGFVEDIDKLCGTSNNLVMIRDCSSSNLGRDAMLGLLSEGTPTIARDGFIESAGAYQKSYKLRERNAPSS